jgi:tetratricopeptide (TPR) repeat protein
MPVRHSSLATRHSPLDMPTRVTIASLAALLVAAPALARAQSRPPTPSPELARADSLYARKDFTGAAKAYRAVLTATPNDGRAWYRLGYSLSTANDNAGAAEAFERSAAIGHQLLAMYNAAAMHARLGHRDRALAWLDSTLAAGFSGDSILRNDADFASLRSDAAFQQRVATAERAFRPCQSRAESHLFDFWIGEWDVTTPQGQPAGKSSVQQILSQCVLFENWTDGQSGQGKSFNAYNVDYNMWQQFWTDQYGRVTEYRESERTPEGGLRFLAHQGAPQHQSLIRMTFTPIDGKTVRQFGETSSDGGKTWTTSFDLYYHRRG